MFERNTSYQVFAIGHCMNVVVFVQQASGWAILSSVHTPLLHPMDPTPDHHTIQQNMSSSTDCYSFLQYKVSSAKAGPR